MCFIYSSAVFFNSSHRTFHIAVNTMGAHDAEFSKAKERLNQLKEDPGNDVKLKIYGLFKQVTFYTFPVKYPKWTSQFFILTVLLVAVRGACRKSFDFIRKSIQNVDYAQIAQL